jgi:hypothetical protein
MLMNGILIGFVGINLFEIRWGFQRPVGRGDETASDTSAKRPTAKVIVNVTNVRHYETTKHGKRCSAQYAFA